MNLKDYYLANNSISEWWNKYNTTGRDRIFYYVKSTNFRYLKDFINIFEEFRNEFEKSIEIQANYIVLCPRCHKMIHHAIDEARKPIITNIFNERAERLKKCGLNIECKEIYKYYHLNEYKSGEIEIE